MPAFTSTLYRIGINLVVDVPGEIATELQRKKGPIPVTGYINGFAFHTNLMPVKSKPYLLYVNMIMMKGGSVAEGDTVKFEIVLDTASYEKHYPMVKELQTALSKQKLRPAFNALTDARKKDILKYLNGVKSKEIRQRHIANVCHLLKSGETNVRIP